MKYQNMMSNFQVATWEGFSCKQVKRGEKFWKLNTQYDKCLKNGENEWEKNQVI